MTAEIVNPTTGVTMTDKAIAHTRRQLAKRPDALGIRLGVKISGCSGYKYLTDWVEASEAEDLIYQVAEDVAVYVRKQDLPIVNGTEIDFVTEGLNSVFYFHNPNSTAECGCGESFAVS